MSAYRQQFEALGLVVAPTGFVGYARAIIHSARDAKWTRYFVDLTSGRWCRQEDQTLWYEFEAIAPVAQHVADDSPLAFARRCVIESGFDCSLGQTADLGNYWASRGESRYLIHGTTKKITCYTDVPISMWTLEDFSGGVATVGSRCEEVDLGEGLSTPPRPLVFLPSEPIEPTGANVARDLF